MTQQDEELLRELLEVFSAEADEHLRSLNEHVAELERVTDPSDRQTLLREVFRDAHTLKGAAGAVGLGQVTDLAHRLEGLFAQMQENATAHSAQGFDLAYRLLDGIAALVGNATRGQDVEVDIERLQASVDDAEKVAGLASSDELEDVAQPEPLVRRSQEAGASASAEEDERRPDAKAQEESVRVATSKLDSLVAGLRSTAVATRSFQEHLGQLEALVEALVASMENREGQLKNVASELPAVRRRLHRDRRRVDHALAQLQDDVRQTRLVPVSALLKTFPRMVRDLARQEKKDVSLDVVGEDTEIDRAVLEQIKGPLIHLVRNCIDHGLETPENRTAAGKPAHGTLRIRVSQAGDLVLFDVADDGAGIDVVAVKNEAVRRGFVTADQARMLSDREAIQLIFHSGVSTSAILTDLSGRGVGLDAVREGVERINGVVEVRTEPGRGTRFSLKVPLTIATTRCVLVGSAGQTFAIPANAVLRTVGVQASDIGSAEGRALIRVDGDPVPLARLSEVLGTSAETEESKRKPALLLGAAERRVAFLVDRVVGVEDLVIVPLPEPLPRLQHISGATLVPRGDPVVVLSPADLVASADRSIVPTDDRVSARAGEAPLILVVDDSITTRTLEKNILETAGYRVCVATDGVEAWTTLQSDGGDLVVSDIQMPRMDGFELTQKIRSDARFRHLPVVLVTSLESADDKERGIEAGADAYIVKSAFDQEKLLDAIRRLI